MNLDLAPVLARQFRNIRWSELWIVKDHPWTGPKRNLLAARPATRAELNPPGGSCLEAAGCRSFTPREPLARAAIRLIQNFDHVRDSLPVPPFLHARAKLEHAARVRSRDPLGPRGVHRVHFFLQ